MSLIEIKNLSKIYDKGKPNELKALDVINLKVEKGEFLAIMGVSGSGKSTLMNIIGCLDRPTSGQYFLEGEEIDKKSSAELVRIRRKKIGFVFQDFNLLPRLSALSNVELPLIYNGVRPRMRHKKAMQTLTEVGLEKRVKHKPSELSGGELQRVAIARALVTSPAVILADEPTGNLDTKSGQGIMALLDKLNNEGTTIIVVTHDPKVAEHAKVIIKIEDGKII